MSELEYPKHKNRSAKVNFLVMIFFFITSILVNHSIKLKYK